nr:hypothetical protein [Tanacetum cinerariifolium]
SVVKPGSIRTVLSLATSRHWSVHQLDVKNALLYGDLSETVYMHQPSGFRDSAHPDYVCLLQTSLFGLNRNPVNTEFKQGDDVQQVCLQMHEPREPHFSALKRILSLATSRHWSVHQLDVKNALLYGDLSETVYMHQPSGFRDSAHPDYETDTAYLLLYVNDIVITASSELLLQHIIASLHHEFPMTDLGSLNYFLGIYVTSDFPECSYHNGDDGDPVSDPTFYRNLGGAL